MSRLHLRETYLSMLRVPCAAFILEYMTIVNEILEGHPQGRDHHDRGTRGKEKSSVKSNKLTGRNRIISL
jgi:hypothetical protein